MPNGILPDTGYDLVGSSKKYRTADPLNWYQGNVDLFNRPSVPNPKGGVSTVYSMSFKDKDGKETLIPRVVEGKILGPHEAVLHYKISGKHLGKFDTIEEADAMGQKIHQQQEMLANPDFISLIQNLLSHLMRGGTNAKVR